MSKVITLISVVSIFFVVCYVIFLSVLKHFDFEFRTYEYKSSLSSLLRYIFKLSSKVGSKNASTNNFLNLKCVLKYLLIYKILIRINFFSQKTTIVIGVFFFNHLINIPNIKYFIDLEVPYLAKISTTLEQLLSVLREIKVIMHNQVIEDHIQCNISLQQFHTIVYYYYCLIHD